MKFYILDCFAQEKYQGNELLVVFADRPINRTLLEKLTFQKLPLSCLINKLMAGMMFGYGRQTREKSPLPDIRPLEPPTSFSA